MLPWIASPRPSRPDATPRTTPPTGPPAAVPDLEDITQEARSLADFDGHEQVFRVTEPASGLHAIIALHDATLGPSLGGCRMWRYADERAAITAGRYS